MIDRMTRQRIHLKSEMGTLQKDIAEEYGVCTRSGQHMLKEPEPTPKEMVANRREHGPKRGRPRNCDSRGPWRHPFARWRNVSGGTNCDTLIYRKSTLRGGRSALFARFGNRIKSVSGFSPMRYPSQHSSCPPSDRRLLSDVMRGRT